MKSIRLFVISFVFLSVSLHADEAAKAPTDEPGKAPAATEAKPSSSGAEKVYTGEALKVKEQVIALFEASKNVNKAGESDKARGVIETGLDWDRIAKDCLGNTNWNKQAGANRDQFRALLKKVISKTAYSRMDSFWTDSTTYKFQKIDVKGTNAVVKTKFNVKDDVLVLEYFMQKKAAKWVIYDIAYDDIRYSENINEQITAFLKEGKFAGLLDKLKKRLAEIDNAKDDDDKAKASKKS